MCGIVGAVAQRDVSPVLLEGLKRLEYRGYDSAGLAVIDHEMQLQRIRVKGKVNELMEEHQVSPLSGGTGIAHTRWATHGKPNVHNAHPHICRDQVALVHNGIIENYEQLRELQRASGFEFSSETDTEVVVNAVYEELQANNDILQAVFATTKQLKGAYALGVINNADPERLIAAKKGSPLVIGVGIGEYFIASDVFALLPVTQQFIFLEDGDVADIKRDSLTIYDSNFEVVERPLNVSELNADVADKAGYRHYMLKEIFSQPNAIAESLENRIKDGQIMVSEFGQNAESIFSRVKAIKIAACGTSYHAGLIAAYWMEEIAQIPCHVEIASEYRYRKSVVSDSTLFVSISQSGETADTLAALQLAKQLDYLSTLAICNVAESSLTRESELVFLTHAGPEIGVASTKAFTTQITVLTMMALKMANVKGTISQRDYMKHLRELEMIPTLVAEALKGEARIKEIAEVFKSARNFLYLGRSYNFPVALEGALKLKEISYIHAEGYPAAEMKHGPIALIDEQMPVVVIAVNSNHYEKVVSNIEEIKARKGVIIAVVTEGDTQVKEMADYIIEVPRTPVSLSPLVTTIPLQLLSYHIAVMLGKNVDQPRNLAKSVTVE